MVKVFFAQETLPMSIVISQIYSKCETVTRLLLLWVSVCVRKWAVGCRGFWGGIRGRERVTDLKPIKKTIITVLPS